MKKLMLTMAAVAALAGAAAIDEKLAQDALAKGEKIAVWPDGKVPAQKGASAFVVKDTNGGIVRLSDVDVPELAFFPAPGGAAQNPCVVVCPGGGYSILAYNHEGVEIAEWLNKNGFSAFILKYRCPDQPDAALMDAQRALSLIRAKAADYKVDPDRLGIMGFSAGANLTCRVATNHKTRAYAAVDAADEQSCRPDFALPIYPWTLVPDVKKGEEIPLTLRPKFPVDKTTPPAFIVQSEDDGCLIENSLAYYAALKRAGVKAEMHLFARGGHGYGIRKHGTDVDGWEELAAKWLSKNFGTKGK